MEVKFIEPAQSTAKFLIKYLVLVVDLVISLNKESIYIYQ